MMIYHYTTIDSLALTLKNQTLLFNRLDCVDDIEEGSVESSGIYIGKCVFVSCWTESKEGSVSALFNIEITLSPNATEGQRVIVESLIRQYAPSAVIKDSALDPLVKF